MNRQAKKLQPKAKQNTVTRMGAGRFEVTSSTSGNKYIVRDLGGDGFRCSCDWAKYHPAKDCSHTLAVREWLAQANGASLSFWAAPDDAARQHRHTEALGFGLWSTERREARQ